MLQALKAEVFDLSVSDDQEMVRASVRLHLVFDDAPDDHAIRRTERVVAQNMPNRPGRLRQRLRSLAIEQSKAYFDGAPLGGDVSIFADLPPVAHKPGLNLAALDDAALWAEAV